MAVVFHELAGTVIVDFGFTVREDGGFASIFRIDLGSGLSWSRGLGKIVRLAGTVGGFAFFKLDRGASC